jgi:glycosyltransferase involved in cell wall biosynthesis
MAFGKPVVAARASAVPEVVVDGETGLLVDPNDAEALARALAVLLSDPTRRRALGEEGRRRVERFRADRVAEAFLRGVQAALSGLPGPHGQTHFTAKVPLATDELRTDTVWVRGVR